MAIVYCLVYLILKIEFEQIVLPNEGILKSRLTLERNGTILCHFYALLECVLHALEIRLNLLNTSDSLMDVKMKICVLANFVVELNQCVFELGDTLWIVLIMSILKCLLI